MVINPLKLPRSIVGGMLAIVFFCVFTLVSVALFPGAYSPLDNWISDLGNKTYNPSGNLFFDAGCILAGLSFLLMMSGLDIWSHGMQKNNAMLLARICGTLSALALVGVGIFSEDWGGLHGIVSITFFLMLFFFILVANIGLKSHPMYNRWIGYYAIVVAAVDVIFGYTFVAYAHNTIWEWLAVLSALLWVALFSYNTLKLDSVPGDA